MIRNFRKYHRFLAIIMTLPLALTIVTGLGYTFFADWLHLEESGEWLLELHTGEIFGLEEIYPILNGLGAIGLLITGVTMTGLMRRKRKPQSLQQ